MKSNPPRFALEEIARLPAPGDNMAVAVRPLASGIVVAGARPDFRLPRGVLEGHRFAVAPVAPGEALLSCGLPFGYALTPIQPGDYVCNQRLLTALAGRRLEFELPENPNFRDHYQPYQFDERTFRPERQTPSCSEALSFPGYLRPGGRGVGTRNYVVILATSARANAFVRLLAERFADAPAAYPGIDGVAPVAHTEGGAPQASNLSLLQRALAGFAVHPNVGAVLLVDRGETGGGLRQFMAANRYPLEAVIHEFFSFNGPLEQKLDQAAAIIAPWLPMLNAMQRRAQPASALKLALQCGGSDAFSGISGNPLAGRVARNLIAQGGTVNLAETNELVGAESYILSNTSDLPTARRFVELVARFREYAMAHGQTLESNPSGGNYYRGLYNITLKSIGAAMKKPPEVRLDAAIDYAERMTQRGFYFMDSPGNDLESVSGQVAAGANVVFFITGSGSVTNFPFAPTMKIVSTTNRYRLLQHDMDVDAGAYLDGAPMDELADDTFSLMLRVAGGDRTAGERTRQSQVQIWRHWSTDAAKEPLIAPTPTPLAAQPGATASAPQANVFPVAEGHAIERLGLVLPASLCAGQVARLIADELGRDQGSTRFVALPHTEGCGVSSGPAEEICVRTLLGHLRHQSVAAAVVLEHGCEKTHNDYLREALAAAGGDPGIYGWASIQQDGGIDRAKACVVDWFSQRLPDLAAPAPTPVGLGRLRLGLSAIGPLNGGAAAAIAQVARVFLGGGGTVVLPAHSDLLASALGEALGLGQARPDLAYAAAAGPGLHLMDCPGESPTEAWAGLVAGGVDLILAHVAGAPVQGHPMAPVVQAASDAETVERHGPDLDWCARAGQLEPEATAQELLELLARVASRLQRPKLASRGFVDFQITRGRQGVSL